MSKRRISTLTLVRIAGMSAVALVLMFLDFPLPLFPGFLKMDLSDLPALLCGMIVGPWAGVAVEFLKNALHLFRTSTNGIGELANFLMGGVFVLTAAATIKVFDGSVLVLNFRSKSFHLRFHLLIAMIFATILMCAVGMVVNYYITFPWYIFFFHMSEEAICDLADKALPFVKIDTLWQVILFSTTPFNLIKSFFIAVPSLLLFKYVNPLLMKSASNKKKEEGSD
jgi:riboflavin transporter FmnP